MFLKRIDRYIIVKFLGTYFLSIALIISIAVVFDITEKIDDFLGKPEITLKMIVFDYYLNFIPYFSTLFSPLFVFISVIFFTSKLAENTEIIAMLSGGISFRRLMLPYFISAFIIASMTFYLNAYSIPKQNIIRLNFENTHIKHLGAENAHDIQMEVEPGLIVYINSYNEKIKRGYGFSMEKFEDKKLVSRLTAKMIEWDTLSHWRVMDYLIRDFDGLSETLHRGMQIDTTIMMQPSDFLITRGMQEQMTLTELNRYLDKQKARGVGNIKEFEVEYYRRFSFPFAAFILTLIGVSLSSHKKRGGIGLNIGMGLVLSFSYILLSTVSSTFAINGNMSPMWSMWITNLIYLPIGIFLYIRAPK